MKEIERDGVLIDICPNCNRIWPDKGELDKMIRPFNQRYGEHDNDDWNEGNTLW